MEEVKVVNQALRARNKKLIDWGLSVETADTINVMEHLLNNFTSIDTDKNNTAQSLFIGILLKFNPQFSKLTDQEIKDLINVGFNARQERKRKRLNTGILTRDTFESEFLNGAEIFDWLMQNQILKKISKTKGYFKAMTQEQRSYLELTFPDHFGRITAILELSQDLKINPKPQYFYQDQGIQAWRNL